MEDYISLANKILAKQPKTQLITQPKTDCRLLGIGTDEGQKAVMMTPDVERQSRRLADQLVRLEGECSRQIPADLEARFNAAADLDAVYQVAREIRAALVAV
jgi:hypothetical protein